jgi:hypothetical protein
VNEAKALAGFGESLIGALSDIHRVNEVQNMLLIRIGEALLTTMVKVGLDTEAAALAGQFSMAAEVLKAGASLTRDRLNEKEEE